LIDKYPDLFPNGVKQNDHKQGEDKWQQQGVGLSAPDEQGIEESDDQDIKEGQDDCQEKIDGPSADHRTHIQQVVLQNPEGQHNGGNEAEVPHGVNIEAADGKYIERNEKRTEPQSPQDVFNTILFLVVLGFLHPYKEGIETIADGKTDEDTKEMKGLARLGDDAEIKLGKPLDEQIRRCQDEKNCTEAVGHILQPAAPLYP